MKTQRQRPHAVSFMRLRLDLVIFFLATSCCPSQCIHNTVGVLVKNRSPFELNFSTVLGQNPGNNWTMSSNALRPGSDLVVNGTCNSNIDLFTMILYDIVNAPSGTANVSLWLLDPRQFHTVQPEFALSVNRALVSNRTLVMNPHVDPTAMVVLYAEITLLAA